MQPNNSTDQREASSSTTVESTQFTVSVCCDLLEPVRLSVNDGGSSTIADIGEVEHLPPRTLWYLHFWLSHVAVLRCTSFNPFLIYS